MKSPAAARLYGILDLGYVTRDRLVALAREMIAGGIDAIQLRAKGHPPATIEAMGREILPLTREAGVPFIVNDLPAVAAALGAEGVHVGQDDLPMAAVRALVGGSMLVGRSTHSLAQARAAAAEGADYIGFGPVFATPTKPDYPPIGTGDLAAVHREHPALPIYCIGGIKRENLPALLDHGVRRVVIVSGILEAHDPAAYVREVKEMMRGRSEESG